MKKILSVAAISLCVLGAAGAAQASTFTKSDLTQVIYQELGPLTKGTVEYGTSLISNFSTFDLTQTNVELAPVGNIPAPSTYGMSWSEMRLGFYADGYNGTVTSKYYFATTSPTLGNYSTNMLNAFDGAASAVATYYEGKIIAGSSRTALVDPSQNGDSYDLKMNGNSTAPGQYAGLNKDLANGNANLGLLDTQDHVDMYLYQISRVGSAWANVAGASTPYVATLRFNLNGSTVFNPVDAAAVPAPASMLLIGSGLIGLLGLRRKKN